MILGRCVIQGLCENSVFIQDSLKRIYDRHAYRKAILQDWLNKSDDFKEDQLSGFCTFLAGIQKVCVHDLDRLQDLKMQYSDDNDIPLSRCAIINSMIDRLKDDLDRLLLCISQIDRKGQTVMAITGAFSGYSFNSAFSSGEKRSIRGKR